MTWTVTNFIIQVIAGIVGGHAAVIETLAPAGPVLAGVFRGRATAAAYASIGDAERSGPPLP